MSNAKPIPAGEHGPLDPLVVDVGAVRTRQVNDFDVVALGAQAAMQARHERHVHDEVGPRGAANRLDGAGGQPKRQRLGVGLSALEDPHGPVS